MRKDLFIMALKDHERMIEKKYVKCTERYCDRDKYRPDKYCDVSECIASQCAIYYFTHDTCIQFAIALHREFHYPLCRLNTNKCNHDVLHVFCLNPNDTNMVIDARGITDKNYIRDIYSEYSEKVFLNTTEEELMVIAS